MTAVNAVQITESHGAALRQRGKLPPLGQLVNFQNETPYGKKPWMSGTFAVKPVVSYCAPHISRVGTEKRAQAKSGSESARKKRVTAHEKDAAVQNALPLALPVGSVWASRQSIPR